MTSNNASEVAPPQHKRTKKSKEEEEASPSWSSLPDAVAVSCVACLTRLDHVALSLVSKSHRSLVASPELSRERLLIGCTEPYFYVCLHIFPDPTPSWFVLTRNRRLWPIPSNPCQAPESSSFVVVDWGIYVIGGTINGNPTSDVWFLDCFSHTWRGVPSMKTARASASASLVDGKIYVFGGCECEEDSNWAEVFDPKTQTWDHLWVPKLPHDIQHSVVIEGERVYAVDEEDQSFLYTPSECKSWTSSGIRDCKRGYRNDWCAIGQVLFCRGTRRRILWCEPDADEFDWKEVMGLEELHWSLSGSRQFYYVRLSEPTLGLSLSDDVVEMNGIPTMGLSLSDDVVELYGIPTSVHYDISRLSSNSAGNIEDPERLELWSAEISLERRHVDVIWGRIEWCDAVYKLDHLSDSYSVKVLYSASVHV